MPWIMSNVQLVCKDTEPLESLYYWVAYVICDTSLCCENMLWKYGVILLTDTIEQNIVYEHLESDPLNPYCAEDINPHFYRQSPIEACLETYLEPQVFKMILYAEKVNGIRMLAFFWEGGWSKKLYLKCLTRF